MLARSVPVELGAILEGCNVRGGGRWEGMGAGVHARSVATDVAANCSLQDTCISVAVLFYWMQLKGSTFKSFESHSK